MKAWHTQTTQQVFCLFLQDKAIINYTFISAFVYSFINFFSFKIKSKWKKAGIGLLTVLLCLSLRRVTSKSLLSLMSWMEEEMKYVEMNRVGTGPVTSLHFPQTKLVLHSLHNNSSDFWCLKCICLTLSVKSWSNQFLCMVKVLSYEINFDND